MKAPLNKILREGPQCVRRDSKGGKLVWKGIRKLIPCQGRGRGGRGEKVAAGGENRGNKEKVAQGKKKS